MIMFEALGSFLNNYTAIGKMGTNIEKMDNMFSGSTSDIGAAVGSFLVNKNSNNAFDVNEKDMSKPDVQHTQTEDARSLLAQLYAMEKGDI